jgi:hypothetical protein
MDSQTVPGGWLGEARNPKCELRRKSKIRSGKRHAVSRFSRFVLGSSFEFRASDLRFGPQANVSPIFPWNTRPQNKDVPRESA